MRHRRKTKVSIPHWFNQNTHWTRKGMLVKKVSIPHWFNQNLLAFQLFTSLQQVSIPHWFNQNGLRGWLSSCTGGCFNSTLVQSKLFISVDFNFIFNLFQFHTGSIKTSGSCILIRIPVSFNSTLVQSKRVLESMAYQNRLRVSIPHWFNQNRSTLPLLLF